MLFIFIYYLFIGESIFVCYMKKEKQSFQQFVSKIFRQLDRLLYFLSDTLYSWDDVNYKPTKKGLTSFFKKKKKES